MSRLRPSRLCSWVVALASLAALAAFSSPILAQEAQQQPQQQQTQAAPANQPQAEIPPPPPRQSVTEEMLMRDNSRIVGRVSIPDTKLGFLEQPQGRTWRQFHETWGPWILGVAVLLTLIVLALLYMFRGRQRYPREGRPVYVIRYRAFERFNHWMTATSFVILALTGLNYVFGKRLLMPLIGPNAFGDFSQVAKLAHNFFAWPFVLGVLVMLFVWARDSLPRRVDYEWIRTGGGVFRETGHISAGRFNAGQKLLFWFVVLLTIVMFGSGLMLLFPFALTDVNSMQLWGSVHTIAGALFVAMIIAHIYIGTAGTEGAFTGMGTGEVELAWARHHHDLWADQATRADTPPEPVPPGHTAPTRGS